MGFFSKRIGTAEFRNSLDDLMAIFTAESTGSGSKIGEITYFICLKILSESVGKLPLKLYKDKSDSSTVDIKHPINAVLRRPNPYMTPFAFWGALELNKNHTGNGYAYINTVNGSVDSLWIMESDRVQVWIDDAGIWNKPNAIWYVYTAENGMQYRLSHEQVIHHKSSVSFNGITGLSAKDTLSIAFDNAKAGQKYINTIFNSGLSSGAVVYYTGDIDGAAKKLIQSKLKELGTGVDNAGGVLPLPIGMKFEQLQQNLVNAQFLELNKYNAQQISAVWGIKPSMINDYSNSKYASSQAEQQAYYVDTLMPILTPLESEVSYKLLKRNEFNNGYAFEWDIDEILRADFETRMQTYGHAIDKAIMTVNEIRKREGYPPLQNGDVAFVNGTYMPLVDIGKQYA